VVVNSAGIMPLGRIADGDVEVFDKVIAINLRGAFLVLRQAARHVVEGGRIIALSSSVVAMAFPTYGLYIASKAWVEGLVHVLTNELRGRNITVNAVAPGPVATELFLHDKTEAQIEQFSKLPPLERLGQPEDIANVVAFLAGPDGGWVNGQVLRANGGLPDAFQFSTKPYRWENLQAESLIALHRACAPQRRMHHEARHCHHRRVERLRRSCDARAGLCRSHRLRQHARDFGHRCRGVKRAAAIQPTSTQ
jgi:Enoyl-(Acyl carrier protein) reductase